METMAGKFVGGFSSCACGLMRFSRPGHPPQHYYVSRELVERGKDDVVLVRPNAPGVAPLAPPCTREVAS